MNQPLSLKSTGLSVSNWINPIGARSVLALVVAIAWFALSAAPKAFGVTPAPDGGYPNGNTAEGEDALFSLTANGSYNTAVGIQALHDVSTGSSNTAVGAAALEMGIGTSNTAVGTGALAGSAYAGNSGNYNTAVGDGAASNNGPASANTALGFEALLNNLQGDNNTATGYQALYSNGTGTQNTATGVGALYTNNYGNYNTATGLSALHANYSGSNNTANGINALLKNTSADGNTGLGANALQQNTTGAANTANGYNTLITNTIGNNNTTTGVDSLEFNKNGNNNTATGAFALNANTSGSSNTAEGNSALNKNTTGSNNTAFGFLAGQNLTTGSNNIDIGANVPGSAGEANTIRIGKSGTQQKTFIAGISGKTVASGIGVIINAQGQLGTIQSSARFKDNIKPMDKASEAILQLKPVTFRYKEEVDPDKIPQFGLVAEEVAKVNPDLVIRDEEGKATTVRYDAVNAMLLNEFLRARHELDKQKVTIAQLQKQIEGLTAGLHNVNAKVELRSSIQQTAADN